MQKPETQKELLEYLQRKLLTSREKLSLTEISIAQRLFEGGITREIMPQALIDSFFGKNLLTQKMLLNQAMRSGDNVGSFRLLIDGGVRKLMDRESRPMRPSGRGRRGRRA